jgi:hypothetical protein
MGDDEQPTKGDTVPKLTIGQRLLTALPRVGAPAVDTSTPGPEPDTASDSTARSTPRQGARRSAPVPDVTDDAGAGDGGTGADDTAVSDHEVTAGDVTASGHTVVLDGEPVPDDVVDTTRSNEGRAPAKGAGPAKGTSGMSKDELVSAIKRINDQERKIGLFIAPVGAVLGILLTIVAIHTNPAVGHKDHVSQSVLVWEGVARIVLSAVVALAALSRRRSFLGFALLFLGTSFGSPIVALPFWFVGGWLIWRAFKWQKELAAITGSDRRAAAGGRGTTRSDSRGRGRSAAEQRPKKKQSAPKGPEASKRYTPPKPTRPKPPAPSS